MSLKNISQKISKRQKLFLEIFFVTGIVLLAIALRFWQIYTYPAGVYADVAANGLDGLDIVQNGNILPFYTRNAGREGLFYYFLAIVQLFEKSYVAMYITTAIIGSATVIVHYLVARSIWGIKIAAVATFLLSTSFFHIHYSRLGYRTILMPLTILIIHWLLLKLTKTMRLRWAISAGIAIGGGFYTYLSYRTYILAILIAIGYFYFTTTKFELKLIKKRILQTSLVALLTALPLFIYLLFYPQFIFGRSGGVLTLSDIPGNILETLSIFGWGGDPEFQYNIPGRPVVNIVLGGFFVIGIGRILQKWRNFNELLVFLTIGSQLGIIAITDRVPHMLRAVSITSFMFIIIAIGAQQFWRFLNNKWPQFFSKLIIKIVAALLFSAVLVSTAIIDTKTYFVDWVNQPNLTRSEFFTDYIALGEYMINDYQFYESNDVKTYIVSTYYRDNVPELNYFQIQTTDYILQTPHNPPYNLTYLEWISDDQPGYYFVKLDDEQSKEKLLELNPESKLVDTIENPYEENIPIYELYMVP